MSARNDSKATHPHAPKSNEPHGISFTLIQPTPPSSPNFADNFSAAQTKPAKSTLSGSDQTKKNS
ncbi:hypothetical protein BD413DRAFT_613600 [Trametes elegans]|nr:hypothetical protein BD413DRAFT_613600 [Trametes elegans]